MIASSMTSHPVLSKLQELGQGDLLKTLLQAAVQACIDLEAEERIGAAPHERTEARTTQRNGQRPRTLETRLGKLEIGIPKLREGSFFPSLLEPRRMVEQAMLSVIQEAWVQGISTRSVDNLVKALGLEGMDKSKVSRLCASISERVNKFRERAIESEFLYIWVDATYIKVREDGRVVGKAFIIATGLNTAGEREVIGFTLGHSESYESWFGFFRSLIARGLRSPLLVISDDHKGLTKALHEAFTGASWQRCRVHYMRNVLSAVSKHHQPMVSAALKQIYMQPDQAAAFQMVSEVADRIEKQLPKIAEKAPLGDTRDPELHVVPARTLASNPLDKRVGAS